MPVYVNAIFHKAALVLVLILCAFFSPSTAQNKRSNFHVIAFFSGTRDQAHISYVQEANTWFTDMARRHRFEYDTTSDWTHMNSGFLAHYQVVIFLDTRPDSVAHREAFRQYIENGGAWLGFHFAGFALTPSAYPQNWNWYHEEFLGAGEYKGNTWRPTAALLQVENKHHPVTTGLPITFLSSPNEWYSWKNDLRTKPDIRILLSIHPSSFPLGTGPKPHEIWHSGYYPVVWTNTRYRMVYMNMGHNDMDYENKTNRQLSNTFSSKYQNKLVLNALLWLAKRR